ncbi:uncharacterized protein B0H18DRAFT_915170, partial [Fomitopsis serialis]|uniref:uncharacterized protein n=1 Tax=Fomitopsis serialis TaxID=139415 RepID=UPI0020075BEF
MVRLPPELTDRIIDYLHTDVHSLCACALTCRTWLPAARYHRFRSVSVAHEEGIATFETLVASSPAIGHIVEDLEISFFGCE